MKTCFI